MNQIPSYNPSDMDFETVSTIIAYFDHTGMMLCDKKNFPTQKHYYAKVKNIKNDPQLGDAFIHYALGLDNALNAKNSKLSTWHKAECEKLKQKGIHNTYSKEWRELTQKYVQFRKKIKMNWANWFKETKRKEGREIGFRSYRSVTFLKGA